MHLKPYREEWRLTLKLIHSWKQFTSFGGDFQWKAGTQISHWYVKDDTETCKLTLLDTVATTIIGSKAVELWDDEDPKIHPMPVQDLTAITSDNVTNGSDTFKVSEVWSGDYIQRIESISEPVSLIETMSSTLSGGDFPGIDGINENSSEDFSTPNNKHKEDDCDQMDMTSTSNRLCTKIIKKEKTKTD
ncbi:hypothetical protein HID58_000868 [Brassica napus]|uniref:DUF223 domain-containing protein n=1 Tax=Brassica napus TaxID=3708 RepID=A0ABQ8EI31_BRANA|nr:hypothetical protein HID58_000868 [Brassica napus]